MIITRTPFRVSFAGGGSDIKTFYEKNGYGAVISTTIQKYMYIVIHPYFHDKIRIKYAKTEDVNDVNAIQHPIVRECLRRVGVEKGVEIASFADISSGTGLGSSSAFTVGLLNALYAYRGKTVSSGRLAREASEIEIDILKEPIGKQDQYAAAFGGLNYLRFNRDETVEVSPILLTESVKKKLETKLRLYYVGGMRHAREILGDQKMNLANDSKVFDQQKRILKMTVILKNCIAEKQLDEIGNIFNTSWLYKRELADGITNETVDRLYSRAMEYGAKGGKLLGAGGAGFLLIYHGDHGFLAEKMGCRSIPLKMDREGTKIIFFDS